MLQWIEHNDQRRDLDNICKQTNRKALANCTLQVRNRRDYLSKKFNRNYSVLQFYKLILICFNVFHIRRVLSVLTEIHHLCHKKDF